MIRFWLSDFIVRSYPTFVTFYATLQQLLKTDLKTDISKEVKYNQNPYQFTLD